MKKSYALAACAALTIGFAACGDDDDDASGDTTALTAPDTEAADDTTVSDDTATTVGGDVAGTDAGGALTVPTGSVSEDVTADCQTFQDLNESLPEADPPAVGDEISDEYKDTLREAKEVLEDVDLESDEGDAARDSLIDDLDTAIDADTWTEELQALGGSEEVVTFGTMCAATVVES